MLLHQMSPISEPVLLLNNVPFTVVLLEQQKWSLARKTVSLFPGTKGAQVRQMLRVSHIWSLATTFSGVLLQMTSAEPHLRPAYQ